MLMRLMILASEEKEEKEEEEEEEECVRVVAHSAIIQTFHHKCHITHVCHATSPLAFQERPLNVPLLRMKHVLSKLNSFLQSVS